MDENIKDQDVLLVKEPGGERLKVVSGMDDKGNLKAVPLTKENEPDFLRFDKHSNALENFISNFMRQVKDPTHFSFFKVPTIGTEQSATFLEQQLGLPDDPASKAFIDNARLNTEELIKGQEQSQSNRNDGYKPLDPERINWEEFERLGIDKESLEKSKSLDEMLNYRKSPGLVPITLLLGDTALRTEARLSLREGKDGLLIPVIHAIHKEPQVDKPFYGLILTAQEKKTLCETGNLGRVAHLKMPNGEGFKAFVSVDKLTNDLVALRTDRVRLPNEIKGVTLSDEQKHALAEGKAIALEGMTAKSGKSFNASVQINADKRGIAFRFDNQPKQSQQQAENAENRTLRVPEKILGRDVSPEEQDKLKAGQTVYMTGLIDRQGQPFNAYVKPNYEKNKFDFLKWNPDKSKAKDITPDNASATQVAVNSEGKTNDATKGLNEPLKQGQVQPTEQQEEAQKRSKGIRR